MGDISMFWILSVFLCVSALVQNVITESEAPNGHQGNKVSLRERLDEIEKAVIALEHYFYIDTFKVKEAAHSLQSTAVEKVDSGLDTVDKNAAAMVAEVDQTLAEVREDLSEIETQANARNVIVGELLYYHGIKSPCDQWYGSCSVPTSECRDGMCQCQAGFSYDSLRQACVEECPHGYGNTYQVVNNYIIRGFNERVVNETSVENCKRLCETEQAFVCRSLDYFPRHKHCYLSASTKLDAADGWEYNGSGVHFQRDCLYDSY